MCTGTAEGTVRDEGIHALRDYRFRDFLHQLIFDTLRDINTDLPEVIRRQLAPRLTHQGFPAVDTEKFFAPHHLARVQALGWMRKLQAWLKREQRAGPDEAQRAKSRDAAGR